MILFKNIFVQILSIYFLIISILMFQIGEIKCKSVTKRGIIDDINKGLKYAGQIMGINNAADVANLVSKAFSNQNIIKKQDQDLSTSSYHDGIEAHQSAKDETNLFSPAILISGLLKMMGFDSGKFGALALNGIIVIAQMIGSAFMPSRNSPVVSHQSLSKNHQLNEGEELNQPITSDNYDEIHSNIENLQPRMVRDGTPLDWILDNPSEEVSIVLNKIRDEKIPEYLTETVNNLEKVKGDGECIKMLICKSSPFVWGMQKNVADRIDGKMTNDDGGDTDNMINEFFKYLPDINQYRRHGKLCEEKYAKCNSSARSL